MTAPLARRTFLAGLGAAGLTTVMTTEASAAPQPAKGQPVPFYGEHQSGVDTPVQRHLALVAFELTVRQQDVRALLRDWTRLAARLCQGQEPSASPDAGPTDSGETADLGPQRLTITSGLGTGCFLAAGVQPPTELRAALPAFPGDALEASWCDGDVCLQFCADDPQVVEHAVRQMERAARGRARVHWRQHGWLPAPAAKTPAARNLLGFHDGLVNLQDTRAFEQNVWVTTGAMRAGTYSVVRRIQIHATEWDAAPLAEQEGVIGRRRLSGAPLSGGSALDAPDLIATTPTGELAVPIGAHVREAAAASNSGARLFRRGYNYSTDLGERGLVFIAFMRDPQLQFVPIQTRLSRLDALNEYTLHVGSAVFACPPGVRSPADFWGSSLL